MSCLSHEPRHMTDRACYYDVAAFHRYSAARRRIALDYHSATISRCCSTFRSIAFHTHDSRHDIFSQAPSNAAMHCDCRLFVHASYKIACITTYIHLDWPVETHGDVVHAIRVENFNLVYMLG